VLIVNIVDCQECWFLAVEFVWNGDCWQCRLLGFLGFGSADC